MKRASLIVPLVAVVLTLIGAYTFSLVHRSTDLLVVQALTASTWPQRELAWLTLGHRSLCRHEDFAPTSPFGFAVAAWHESGDNQALKRSFAVLAAMQCDIDRRGRHGLSALHSAVLLNNSAAVRFLIQRGADLNARTNIDLGDAKPPLSLNAVEFARYLDKSQGGDRRNVLETLTAADTH